MSPDGFDIPALVAAFIPLIVVIGTVIGILFVTGTRAARQQRLLDRLLEQSERQTALLKEIAAHRRGKPDKDE